MTDHRFCVIKYNNNSYYTITVIRSSHGQIGLDEHPYTNLNVLTTSDEDHTPVNDELTSSATSTIM